MKIPAYFSQQDAEALQKRNLNPARNLPETLPEGKKIETAWRVHGGERDIHGYLAGFHTAEEAFSYIEERIESLQYNGPSVEMDMFFVDVPEGENIFFAERCFPLNFDEFEEIDM